MESNLEIQPRGQAQHTFMIYIVYKRERERDRHANKKCEMRKSKIDETREKEEVRGGEMRFV